MFHNLLKIVFIYLPMAALLTLAGCARTPWVGSIDEDQFPAGERNFNDMLVASRQCEPSLDGELLVTWSSALETVSFSGYFQLLLPTLFKFTTYNPLGQPLFAFASDGKSFQSVNSVSKKFIGGSLRSYGIRHDLPPTFIHGQWGYWLTGRLVIPASYVLEIRNDSEDRGLWYAVAASENASLPNEYILIDTSNRRVLERIIMDKKGKQLACMTYDNWQAIGECDQPLSITVAGLSFGTRADLALSELEATSFVGKDFRIPYPPSYFRQYWP
ncbi:MAG: DUF4292 domain-containing protein [Deltaproteobacteria bacterium]|nr:DUF4292 domain-containing protein [Deltaproteobacteria bacterium]